MRKIDLAGQNFNMLTVLCEYKYIKKPKLGKFWICVCDCGNFCVIRGKNIKSGNTKSCGCLREKLLKDGLSKNKHGKQHSSVYESWRAIKGRCFDKNNNAYSKYGGAGITMQENFANSFIEFYNYIGDPPDQESKWTIDRINRDLGYVEGNMRWATIKMQARNRGKLPKNKTGVTGVHFYVNHKGYEYFVASWRENEGRVQKLFSVRKLGRDLAFELAVKCREEGLDRLRQLGYGYTESHGL